MHVLGRKRPRKKRENRSRRRAKPTQVTELTRVEAGQAYPALKLTLLSRHDSGAAHSRMSLRSRARRNAVHSSSERPPVLGCGGALPGLAAA
eukprot:683513-Pleurochrysis_carterae.AAC.1